jgi:hypothetical protein
MLKSCFLSLALLCAVLSNAQRGTDPPEFYLETCPNETVGLNKFLSLDKVRRADFIPALYEEEPDKKTIDRWDPGSTGHLTFALKDVISLHGYNDTLNALLDTPGALVYTFENTDLVDSTGFLKLVQDSTTGTRFIAKVMKIRKREWELFRMTIRRKGSEKKFQIFLRYTKSIFTVNLPDKSNRETIKINSIAPAIPVIHLGAIDYDTYKPGPGIAFNIGLIPRRPFPRLISDIVGPISCEVMLTPIGGIDEILATRISGVGFFFNSFYGLLHWGVAFYEIDFVRAEAYIGINLAPAINIFNGGRKQRYRW